MELSQGICILNAEKTWNKVFYSMLSVFVFIYLAALILDYDINWVFGSYETYLYDTTISSLKLNSDDLKRCLTVNDGGRVRYMSNLFYIATVKLRIWLWNYVPPHPSISLSWIFTLVLSPIFLYKFIKSYTLNWEAAWNTVLLYMVSAGYVSGIVWIGHPGKPMILFFAVLCIYLGSKIDFSNYDHEYRKILIFLSAIFVSFFFEEYALILYATMPVLFYKPGKTNIRAVILFFATLAAIVLCMVVIDLYRNRQANYDGLNMWDYYFSYKSHINNEEGWRNFTFARVCNIWFNLLIWSTIPSFNINIVKGCYRIVDMKSSFFYLYCSSLLVYFTALFISLKRSDKILIGRLVAALIVSTLIYSIGHQYFVDQPAALVQGFYYGCMYSLYFSIVISVLLSLNDSSVIFRVTNKLMMVYFISILSYNSYVAAFMASKLKYIPNSEYEDVNIVKGAYPDNVRLTRNMVYDVWKNRIDKGYLQEKRSQYPAHCWWLFEELKYSNK